jgi:hypothetical protein
MLGNLKHKLSMLTTLPTPIDPSRFGDPIASQTEWTLARRGGGASFRTHKLITVGPNRVEFRASLGAFLFYLLFLIPGLGMSIASAVLILLSGKFDAGTMALLLAGLSFVGVSGYFLYSGARPIVFEKARGVFWKGWKGRDEAVENRAASQFARLDDVHALQLIGEYFTGYDSSHYLCELNLVLRNGKRLNVVDHGNRNILSKDAETLAAFLGKPLWDATTRE